MFIIFTLAVADPVVPFGEIIASLTNRYRLMLTLSIVSLAMLLAIILYVPMSLSMFTVLYF
ncbi:hypothetical protein, partial [Francisella tularensis]|uniref:hypothetical protein n=1 Tax=Francisella tularensis TaxID=263 RepID=UPI002955559C